MSELSLLELIEASTARMSEGRGGVCRGSGKKVFCLFEMRARSRKTLQKKTSKEREKTIVVFRRKLYEAERKREDSEKKRRGGGVT
jgi:hypothetical protein